MTKRCTPAFLAAAIVFLVPSTAGRTILFSASLLSKTSTTAAVCTTATTPANASS